MTPTLYFLRSSENKIVTNMLQFAHPDLDENKIKKFSEFYGLTNKDLGLYALVEGKIAGAIWSRKFQDDTFATLSIAVLPEFRKQRIATTMMEQFLLEAATQYDGLQIETYGSKSLIAFLEKVGFKHPENTSLMTLKLEKKELLRPTDGYDPRRWMD